MANDRRNNLKTIINTSIQYRFNLMSNYAVSLLGHLLYSNYICTPRLANNATPIKQCPNHDPLITLVPMHCLQKDQNSAGRLKAFTK